MDSESCIIPHNKSIATFSLTELLSLLTLILYFLTEIHLVESTSHGKMTKDLQIWIEFIKEHKYFNIRNTANL